MARSTFQIQYSNPNGLMEYLSSLLQSKGYKYITENNEYVWKCGVGFWTAMKYIKIEFAPNNIMLVSGWIRPMLGSEQDLNGMVGALPKKQVMNVIQQIQNTIR